MPNKAPFCASLCLIRTVFSWLLKKAVSMALWTKPILCGKSSLLEQSMPRTPSWPKTSVTSVISLAKNPFNQRNLRLIKDLRSTKDYVRKNNLFLQNEPNFRKSQMSVSYMITKVYVQMNTWSSGENEPKTNPIKANSNSIQTQSPARIPQTTTDKAYLVKETNVNVYKKQPKPNFFGAKPLHPTKKHQSSRSVDFLQHKALIHIRVVFRKVETKLRIYTQVSSTGPIFGVSNKAKKKCILGRLGTIFALISY